MPLKDSSWERMVFPAWERMSGKDFRSGKHIYEYKHKYIYIYICLWIYGYWYVENHHHMSEVSLRLPGGWFTARWFCKFLNSLCDRAHVHLLAACSHEEFRLSNDSDCHKNCVPCGIAIFWRVATRVGSAHRPLFPPHPQCNVASGMGASAREEVSSVASGMHPSAMEH